MGFFQTNVLQSCFEASLKVCKDVRALLYSENWASMDLDYVSVGSAVPLQTDLNSVLP